MYDFHFRCVDKCKNIYETVKVIYKTKHNKEYCFIKQEINLLQNNNFSILPAFNKLYEDLNYYYMTFQYFHGDSLLRIVLKSHLKEASIATIVYKILKGLKRIH